MGTHQLEKHICVVLHGLPCNLAQQVLSTLSPEPDIDAVSVVFGHFDRQSGAPSSGLWEKAIVVSVTQPSTEEAGTVLCVRRIVPPGRDVRYLAFTAGDWEYEVPEREVPVSPLATNRWNRLIDAIRHMAVNESDS